MKAGIRTVALFIIVAGGLCCCKKDEVAPIFDPASLNGTWQGTSTIHKKGLCTFNDSIATVSQVWQVSSAGFISITETFTYTAGPGTHQWIGSVDQDRNFEITRTQETNCFGNVTTKSFTLAGQIQVTPGGFAIQAEMDYSICPPDCLFDQQYVLSK